MEAKVPALGRAMAILTDEAVRQLGYTVYSKRNVIFADDGQELLHFSGVVSRGSREVVVTISHSHFKRVDNSGRSKSFCMKKVATDIRLNAEEAVIKACPEIDVIFRVVHSDARFEVRT